jgi:pimeloyl-ACP methyl ester carboxylesterase
VVLLVTALIALLAACSEDGSPAPIDVAGATVEAITTNGGEQLDARLFAASSDRLVVLLHMYSADQTEWFDTARELQARGWSALTFDFRGYGASSGDRDPKHIDVDTRAAIDWAHERGYAHVALVGASMGGTAALVVAGDTNVDGVFTISAPITFHGLDAEDGIKRTEAPVRLVAARGDVSAARSLSGLAERGLVPPDNTLVTEGRAHGSDMLDDDTGDEVRALLFDFLAEIWG